MSIATRFLVGVLFGASILFFAFLGMVLWGAGTGDPVIIPGIIDTLVSSENGLPAVEFTPNFKGILFALFATGIWYAALGSKGDRNASQQKSAR